MKKLAWILLIVGGLNWGLVGAFNYNVVSRVFGTWPALLTVIYILVGLSALWELFNKKGTM